MTDLVNKLLKKSLVTKVDRQDLHLQLLSHEDFPSLRAITDTLDYFGIENVVASVPKEALIQLPKSFLALLEHQTGNELVFVSQKNNTIVTQNESGEKKIYKIVDFCTVWTGTILAIEVAESKNKIKLSSLSPQVILSVLAVTVVILTFVFKETLLVTKIYTGLSLLGLGMSYFIIKESLGDGNTTMAKVCGAITKDPKGCGAVINSKPSKIFRGLGLGDLSLIYFVSITLVCTFLGVNDSIFLLIAILSLPVILYTLYSQAFILKKWCFLCLSITTILITQFVVIGRVFTSWNFSMLFFLNSFLITIIVSLSWLLLAPLLQDRKKWIQTKKDLLSLKRNTRVFEAIHNEDKIKNLVVVPADYQIYFGHPEAPVQLVAYTNPLCGFCKEAFEGYDRLLTQFPKEVGIQFVFNTPEDDKNPGASITKRIFELYKSDPDKALQSMRDWFASKDIDAWKGYYGESTTMLLTFDKILDVHRDVIKKNEIYYTPETVLGDRKLSRKHYSYDDIALFVQYLKENNKKQALTVA